MRVKLYLYSCLVVIGGLSSSCTSSVTEEDESVQDIMNQQFVDELVESLENPPDPTNPEDIVIDLGEASSIHEALIGDPWVDAGNVGMNVSFSENGFTYLIPDYPPASQPWILIDACEGEESESGPYIQRGTGEYADCYLIVELDENNLMIEQQGASIQMRFRR